ncbi:hypothetical protein [Streptomyces neyagawaensis]|uniref:hypothetical protein n=1 Tax=Streptomyces neyagawaensis TaxID=42238 RepID=UPI0006E414C0|nr:hypothetical protein [Streptomyces neyagawaensis]MCL6737719.1 hypothetical protein [Streptomyces neyagawaensis]MDE1687709.1 hypothetical protein [Streptomyces neyagawaensis]MDG5808468.1 hypothetical protein [Streptomyces ossamyceticus]
MRQIDLSTEIAQLRELGSDFADLHSEVRSLTPTPGTDLRRQLMAHIVTVNELVQRTMERLAVLSGSQYTIVPGSRPALEALASVIYTASVAAADLAGALFANPVEGAPFPGPSIDEAAVRAARQREAAQVMADHLADAAHRLDLAYTGCYYLASGITRDLDNHPGRSSESTVPVPEITDSQCAALGALVEAGGILYVSSRKGTLHATTKSHGRVNIASFKALQKRGLVHVDTGTDLIQGQHISVTAAGHRALEIHTPARTTPPTTAVVAKPPAPARPAGIIR